MKITKKKEREEVREAERLEAEAGAKKRKIQAWQAWIFFGGVAIIVWLLFWSLGSLAMAHLIGGSHTIRDTLSGPEGILTLRKITSWGFYAKNAGWVLAGSVVIGLAWGGMIAMEKRQPDKLAIVSLAKIVAISFIIVWGGSLTDLGVHLLPGGKIAKWIAIILIVFILYKGIGKKIIAKFKKPLAEAKPAE